MSQMIKVGTCQVPDIREDVDGALSWIETYAGKAEGEGISLLCFPECFLQGYLVEEEQARSHAFDLNSIAFNAVLGRLAWAKPMLVFGVVEADQGRLFNTAAVVAGGRLVGKYRKNHLLAGEAIFTPGSSYPVFEVDGLKFGINICFDTTFADGASAIAARGVRLILCPANNMMRRKKAEEMKEMHHQSRTARAKEAGLWLISSDVTGERGDRIALGPTSVIDPSGNVVRQVPLGETGMVVGEIGI